MEIKDIISESDLGKKIDVLKKGRLSPAPEIDKIKNQWDPSKHEIFNIATRPDKTVWYPDPESSDEEKLLSRIEPVARVAIALQKLIVKRATAFIFGNPVKTVSSKDNSNVAKAVDQIMLDNKQDSLNRKVARVLFSSTEVAEYWYPIETSQEFTKYGFPTKMKMKCTIFSPLNGDVLYPFFDGTGAMVAFSRGYKAKIDDEEKEFFETWTEEKYFRWMQSGSEWVDAMMGVDTKIEVGKIPIIYGSQEAVEWSDVQFLIERLEKLLSNFADTNDYHGSPKIAVKGTVKGFSKKGETGTILQLEGDGADAKYLAWDRAPESIKLENENLLRMIYSLTQTPDISFEGVKGLGSSISGQTLKMLFLDAHLKVMDKMEIFDDYLQRRLNLLKAFVGKLNTALQKESEEVELSPQVIPFMVNDEKDAIDNLTTAVSGGIMSKQSAVEQNPLVEDSDKELRQLEAEQNAADASAQGLNKIMNDPNLGG